MERICRETVENDVINVLQTELPESINQLYQESLEQIYRGGGAACDVATKIISWVLFMREPLTPGALLAALMAGKDMTLSLAQAIATCLNFVVLDSKCNVLRFAHQSVQDFLRRQPAFAAGQAHQTLAACCIEASSFGPSVTIDGNLQVPSDDFYIYAAMYWPIHAEISLSLHDDSTEAKDLIQCLTCFIFDQEWDLTLSFESWVANARLLTQLLPRNHAMKTALNAVPETSSSFLFVLSMFGLDDVLLAALSELQDLDFNEENEQGHTALYLAAAFGHAKAVGILVDNGADVSAECGKYGSPLHAACFHGHLEVVSKLLSAGAQVSCGSVFKNALLAAFRGGNEDVVLHLIANTKIIEAEDDYSEALGQAALMGFVDVIQRLHSSRFSSPNRGICERMQEKIRRAIQGGQVGILRQFLGRDATHAQYLPSAAVALATLHNRKNMVEFLLDQGMDLEAIGDFGSPLRTAALLNFQSIVRLLLEKGAQIDNSEPFGDALQAAALNGHTSTVRLLIQQGANVNQYSGYYGSALQAAAYHGHIDTVELLIDSNADADLFGYSRSAIHAAAEGGHEDIIMLLLHKRPRPTTLPEPQCKRLESSPYKPLLDHASPGRSHFEDEEATRSEAGTAFEPGSREPTTDMETILRIAGNGTTSTDSCMEQKPTPRFAKTQWQELRHPLVAAASSGHVNTVSCLLNLQQSFPSVFENLDHSTIEYAISIASNQGHSSVVQILLEYIANKSTERDGEWHGGMKSPSLLGEGLALRLASENCTLEECAVLSRKSSVKSMIYHQSDVSEADMLLDFSLSCKTGNVQLASSILETRHHKSLSLHAVEEGIQLCGLFGQPEIAQLLLESPVLQDRRPSSGMEAFVNAAACGFLDTMMVFASHWADLSSNKEAVGRGLVVASKRGHIAAVRYLVLELGADTNTLLPDECYVPALADPKKLFFNIRWKLRDIFDKTQTQDDIPPVISPLQASLQGLALKLDPPTYPYLGRPVQPNLKKSLAP